ncbi:'Cold-shock' DNA-binding domain protein [bacterium BMS3Bbin02]|nr:'Cold-shock' DNA-binding domain protein [bacterium BMS3Bbin02]
MQGVVKVYDPATGFGLVVSDADRTEYVLGPGALAGSAFRLLRQGQRVNFSTEIRGEDTYAVNLRFGSDGS